jgi:charged multivesicular body protein 7
LKPTGYRISKNELRQNRVFIPLSEFLNAKESVYDSERLLPRLATYVVKKPVWWVLQQLGLVGEDGGSKIATETMAWSEEHVVLALVEKAADAIISRQKSHLRGPGDAVYSIDGFREEFAHVLGDKELCEQDLRVLLRFLERDREVLVVDEDVGIPSPPSVPPSLPKDHSETRSSLSRKTQVSRLGRSMLLIRAF